MAWGRMYEKRGRDCVVELKKGRMTMRMKKIAITSIFVACGIVAMGGVLMARPAGADVKVSMERNSGEVASRAFRFADVPSPIKDNAGPARASAHALWMERLMEIAPR